MDIRVEGVSFSYPSGVVALRDVNLAVATGEAVAIVGENGAGKTTLAKHLNGLLRPGQGRVQIGDWDTREHTVAQMAARAGYVFQNPDEQLFERTVRAEVAFGPRNLGFSQADIERSVESSLSLVGLEALADSHPYDVHPSQRKLVTLAATLAMNTPVVVLDEPTTGQDAIGVARMGRIVDWLKQQRRTVLMISHDIDFCAEHCGRFVVMAGGRILLDGPTREVLRQSAGLAEADVEPPQLVRLAQALGIDSAPITVDEFAAAWAKLVNAGENQ